MANNMNQKVALVMGGGAGTGRATVLAFSAEGAKVVIADINEAGGLETLDQVNAQGGEGFFVKADMGNAADIQKVLAQTQKAFGGLPGAWVYVNAMVHVLGTRRYQV